MNPKVLFNVLQTSNFVGNDENIQLRPKHTKDVGSFYEAAGSNSFYYSISNPSFGQWEEGIGTANSSGQLSRTTVLRNSEGTTSRLKFTDGEKVITPNVPVDLLNAIVREDKMEAATSLPSGGVVGKIAIYGSGGTIVGYIPVYGDGTVS